MQVQKRDKTSFQQFRTDAKGKKALVNFLKGVSEDEKVQGQAKILLTDFRDTMHDYDRLLLIDKPQVTDNNLDTVLTQVANDETGWEYVPAVVIRQGRKDVSSPLYLDEFMPIDKTISSNELQQQILILWGEQ